MYIQKTCLFRFQFSCLISENLSQVVFRSRHPPMQKLTDVLAILTVSVSVPQSKPKPYAFCGFVPDSRFFAGCAFIGQCGCSFQLQHFHDHSDSVARSIHAIILCLKLVTGNLGWCHDYVASTKAKLLEKPFCGKRLISFPAAEKELTRRNHSA